MSIPYLDGATLDWQQQGINEEFVFRNPNEQNRCGCGVSAYFLMEVFQLIAEVGAPIAGALVMLYFLFIIMKQKIEDTVSKVQLLQTLQSH